MKSLDTIREHLTTAQFGFLRAADVISSEQWKVSPSDGRWSAAEVVAHLITVERNIIATADRNISKPPRRLSFIQKMHLPLALVESRVIRRKTPLPMEPELLREKEEMLAVLREVRERTLSFMEETQARDLSAHTFRHPFLGILNTYEWLIMIGSHELRHVKQIKEIAASLPKVVVSSQK